MNYKLLTTVCFFSMMTYALPLPQKTKGQMMNQFMLKSPSFKPGQPIPRIPHKYAYIGCGGKNISPQLAWSGSPAGTQSFALIVDDPDAAPFHDGKTFYHWIMINIPASKTSFEEAGLFSLPIVQLANDYGSDHKRYDGPCPPKGSGVHHYRFTLYALDQDIPVGLTHKVSDLERYVQSHNIGMAQLVGVYER